LKTKINLDNTGVQKSTFFLTEDRLIFHTRVQSVDDVYSNI